MGSRRVYLMVAVLLFRRDRDDAQGRSGASRMDMWRTWYSSAAFTGGSRVFAPAARGCLAFRITCAEPVDALAGPSPNEDHHLLVARGRSASTDGHLVSARAGRSRCRRARGFQMMPSPLSERT